MSKRNRTLSNAFKSSFNHHPMDGVELRDYELRPLARPMKIFTAVDKMNCSIALCAPDLCSPHRVSSSLPLGPRDRHSVSISVSVWRISPNALVHHHQIVCFSVTKATPYNFFTPCHLWLAKLNRSCRMSD